MTPPPNESPPSADQAEEAFVQLLAAWDERLAGGTAAAMPEAPMANDVEGLSERLKKAQDCLKLLNHLWPKPLSNTNGSSARASSERAYARFGRYEIVRELGRGGHGVVFLATDAALKRQVALKIPRPEVLSSDELRMRFLREAEATARLDHPNILPVFEVGQEGPICFTAAAFCDGGTLQDWLARGDAPLAPREAALIVAELATAIHHAHTRGVLHRDLKPSNVLLASRGGDVGAPRADGSSRDIVRRDSRSNTPPSQPTDASVPLLDQWILKISDFGLAKVVDGQHDSTLHGVVLGTANYMAPEQAAGRSADVGVTTDVYSLGVILYELLTGAPPFIAPSQLATLRKVEADEAAWPSKVRRRVPADLRTICLTCLEKEPGDRYPSAAALAADLHRFRRGDTVTARPLPLFERMRRTLWRHPALSLLSVTAFFLAVGFVGQLYQHNRELTTLIQNERLQTKAMSDLKKTAEDQAEENRRRSYGAKLRVVQQFADAGSLRQMTEALHETFPPEGEPDLREFSWRYWWHRCRSAEVFRLPGHGQHVNDAAFSSDGRLIATGSSDGTVGVWDYETGREVARLYGITENVTRVAFSPQGTLLAAGGSQGHLKVWSTDSWQPQATFHGRSGEITGLVFGDEETLISGCNKGWLRAWNPKTQQVKHEYHLKHERYVNCLAVARRSKLLLVGIHNGEIQQRSLSNVADRIRTLEGHKENVTSIAVSLQEDFLFSSDSGVGDLRIQDLEGKPLLPTVSDGLPYKASRTAISPDGRWLAAVADGGRVQVLDAVSGQVRHEKFLDIETVGALAFSHDGNSILAAGTNGQVVLWQPFELRPEQPVGHEKEIWSIAFSRDSTKFVTGSDDDTAREYATTGELLREVLFQSGTVSNAVYSPDESLLATTTLEERIPHVRLWKMPSGTLRQELEGHFGKAYSAAYHPRENVLATGSKEVIVWDVESGKSIRRLDDSHKSDKKVKSIAFSPDGTLLAFGSEDGNTYLYSYPKLDKRQVLESSGEVWSVAFSPDGQQLATGNRDGSVTVWNPRTLSRRFTLKGHLQGVLSVAYAHDGQTIATGSEDATIKLWGPHTGQELCTLKGHDDKVRVVKFSPDDQWLVSGSHEGALRIWHAPAAARASGGRPSKPGNRP